MQFPVKITETRISTVFSGTPAWDSFHGFIGKIKENSGKVFILVDDNTHRWCLPVLVSALPSLHNAEILKIKPGENSKTPEVAFSLWDELISRKAGRDSLLINLGGGVVSDLGGFVASTYKRGIPYINVPTSLIAMADASLGGKTAINLHTIKNSVGTFSLPAATFIIPGFLKTLDHVHLLSGLAEIFKIALVADRNFWDFLTSPGSGQMFTTPFDSVFWEELIMRSAGIKCNIVENDFTEQNDRALLNFGHTIGHAIETLSFMENHKPASHGEAVSVGILCESYLSVRYCGLTENDFAKISGSILSAFGRYPLASEDITELLKFMDQDKKKMGGVLHFTLLKSPGNAIINQPCDTSAIIDSLEYYRKIIANL